MAYETLIVETRDRVGLIRLNRPQALNALNAQLMDELGAALAAFDADERIGAIVITGSEKAFAAGADIKEMQAKSFADAFRENFITANWEATAKVRKPVIAAVAGYALGGGCEACPAGGGVCLGFTSVPLFNFSAAAGDARLSAAGGRRAWGASPMRRAGGGAQTLCAKPGRARRGGDARRAP